MRLGSEPMCEQYGGADFQPFAVLDHENRVAIAKVAQATVIHSDGPDVSTLASRASIKAVKIEELPLPPESPQPDLFERGPISPDEAEIAAAEIESQLAYAESPAGV